MLKVVSSLFFICFIVTNVVVGQRSPQDSSFQQYKKNELLLETVGNLTRLNTPSGIMYRRNIKKISLRLRGRGNYSESHASLYEGTTRNYTYLVAAGVQRNFSITKICQFYGGADFAYSNSYKLSKDTLETILNKSNTLELAPFIGMKFVFRKRLVLGIENLGSYTYTISDKKQEYYDPTIIPNTDVKTSQFRFVYSKSVLFYLGINF